MIISILLTEPVLLKVCKIIDLFSRNLNIGLVIEENIIQVSGKHSYSVCVFVLEPVCEKTNNLGSDQVRHKPGCTVTEDD